MSKTTDKKENPGQHAGQPRCDAHGGQFDQRRAQISAQVDADFRAHLRPELRKLYDLYYTKEQT